MIFPRRSLIAVLTLAAVGWIAATGDACSRILWNDNSVAVVISRTMDWPESTEPVLTVFPRGIERDGGLLAKERIESRNPAKWISKYGSMITSIYGIGAVDGLNEKGLGIHLLYLNSTSFGERDVNRPAVHAGLWGQYLLDQAATVEEALELQKGIQIIMATAHGHQANVHLAIEDASGDSAIVEFLDGKPVIHHGRQFKIMTNDPSYDEQLALLKKLDFSHPSSDTVIPGNVKASDRFQRAAYYAALLPKPKDEREAVAGVLAIARNVSVPFGAPYKGFGIYNTEYRTVMNLTSRRYFFELTTAPNVIWSELSRFDLSPGAPVKALNPYRDNLTGDVSGEFETLPAVPF